MRKTWTILFLFILCQAIPLRAEEKDFLFNILKQELAYYFSVLSRDSVAVSLISLNALEEENVLVTSDRGYATEEKKSFRRLKPDINFAGLDVGKQFNPYSLSEVNFNDYNISTFDLPLIDDSISVKEVIWDALGRKYNGKRSALKSESKWVVGKKALNLTEKGEKYYEAPLPEKEFDTKKWRTLLNSVTGQKRGMASTICKASIEYQKQRKYIMKSDGTEVVQNRITYWITLTASVFDENNVECSLNKEYLVYDETELPNRIELRDAMENLVARAEALSKAPMAEAYCGPVLFSGSACGVLFHEVIGHRLEKNDSDFAPMRGKSIMSDEISLEYAPTTKTYKNQPLNGYYQYDDEGKSAGNIVCLKNGVLNSFLSDSIFLNDKYVSSGHQRASFGLSSKHRQSNMFVDVSHHYSEEQLRNLLIQALKQADLEYGYYVHSVKSGWTMEGGHDGISSFNVLPTETYKVYADGRPDLLVRGVSIIGTPLSVLEHVAAGGGKIEVFNGRCGSESGWIPVSVVSPMLYVSMIETQSVPYEQSDRYVPFNLTLGITENVAGTDIDSLIFKAMTDEIKHSMDSLRHSDDSPPFFVDYAIRRQASVTIESSLGSCNQFESKGLKNKGLVMVLSGDSMRTTYNGSDRGQPFDLPDDISYCHMREELWKHSKRQFVRSGRKSQFHDAGRLQTFIDDNIPEWPKMPSKKIVEESAIKNWQNDASYMKHIADTLSAVFISYPDLYRSRVRIEQNYADVYRTTSEGLIMRTPIKKIFIRIYADVATYDGKSLSESEHLHAYDVEDLPPVDSLIKTTIRFAEHVRQRAKATVADERNYIGPALYVNSDAEDALLEEYVGHVNLFNFIYCGLNLSSRRYSESYKKVGSQVVNDKITVRQLGTDSIYNGHRLFRYQRYDADGISPKSVELIRKGILLNQLAGRIPSPRVLESTGNERLLENWNVTGSYISRFNCGTIQISFSKAKSEKYLAKRLIKQAKTLGLEYAYILQGRGRVSRVNVKTRRKEDLRLACFDRPTRLQLMGDVMASKEERVNYYRSVIHPRTLFFPLMDLHFDDIRYSSFCDRFMIIRR